MSMPKQKPHKSKQTYGTPPELIAAIEKRLKVDFTFDLAATRENAVSNLGQRGYFYTEEDNALLQNWYDLDGWLWCNPPFADIMPWVHKAANEAAKGANIVMLVPASVGSNWWATYVEFYASVAFLSPRLTFVGETTPYPKDCALLFYTPWGFTGSECWRWK